MIVGYARVSTDGQSLEAQHAALKAAGATQIYSEKISGAVTDRKALAKAIASLWADDVLMVTRLDRLARSTGTCSMCSTLLLSVTLAFAHWQTLGRIQLPHTEG
jgi:DNA invertase Pin-like site-specific DNA recombinase